MQTVILIKRWFFFIFFNFLFFVCIESIHGNLCLINVAMIKKIGKYTHYYMTARRGDGTTQNAGPRIASSCHTSSQPPISPSTTPSPSQPCTEASNLHPRTTSDASYMMACWSLASMPSCSAPSPSFGWVSGSLVGSSPRRWSPMIYKHLYIFKIKSIFNVSLFIIFVQCL